jgi:hypothetical protein
MVYGKENLNIEDLKRLNKQEKGMKKTKYEKKGMKG